MQTISHFVGIDIGKSSLVVCVMPDGIYMQFTNDKIGITALIKWLKKLTINAIAYESTGIYHRSCEAKLNKFGYKLIRLTPSKSYYMMKAMGTIAKTDKIDAKNLAKIAMNWDGGFSQVPSEKLREFVSLFSVRDRLVQLHTSLNGDVDDCGRVAKDVLVKTQKDIDKSLKLLEKKMKEYIASDDNLSRLFAILTSIPGIGTITAFAMIAYLPELGSIEDNKIAALTGVAPINRDSGHSNPARHIKGGRFKLRRYLYMGAMSASATHFAEFAQRMRDKGKDSKVIFVAIMRKMVILANHLVRENRTFEPNYQKKTGAGA